MVLLTKVLLTVAKNFKKNIEKSCKLILKNFLELFNSGLINRFILNFRAVFVKFNRFPDFAYKISGCKNILFLKI